MPSSTRFIDAHFLTLSLLHLLQYTEWQGIFDETLMRGNIIDTEALMLNYEKTNLRRHHPNISPVNICIKFTTAEVTLGMWPNDGSQVR